MLTLTLTAAEKVKFFIAQKEEEEDTSGEYYLRVGLKGGGCVGFNYDLSIDNSLPNQKDEVFQSHGIKIISPKSCLAYLSGTKIDYVDKLYGGGFKFDNPHAVTNCGCQASFSVKE